MNENKYTMYIELGMSKKLDNRVLSSAIEDALLLYAAKTGDTLTTARMAIYEDFIAHSNGNHLPEYNSKTAVTGEE